MSIDPRAIERVSGPAWDPSRKTILTAFEKLLSVAAGTASELTTIYVKFKISDSPASPVYAVAWIKTAKKFVIGFRHPVGYSHDAFVAAPKGMIYSGLNNYLDIDLETALPEQITEWALTAHHATLELRDD